MHGKIQFYFDKLYNAFAKDIHQSYFSIGNEIYGELNYYSVLKLLKHLQLSKTDHFLDIGSGLGKIVFQVFLETDINQVTGIEINPQRYAISCQIKKKIEQQLTALFNSGRILEIIPGDVLKKNINTASVIYMSSTVFSYDFMCALGKKINESLTVQKVASLRKIPQLKSFEFVHKLFLHGNWDIAPCYIYHRR
jgi:SAM-dependent methyltransferase